MAMYTLKVRADETTENIVIFVHGFGVRWDSRGMFTEIDAQLPAGWGSVLFDFYEVDGKDVYISPVSEQIGRLKDIILNTKVDFPQATLHIVAHSKGCIITALAKPEISGSIILLSPPEEYSSRFQTYFESVEGAQWIDGTLVVPRKDGTTSHIPQAYFDETHDIMPQEAMLNLARMRSVYIMQTTRDEILGETTYEQLQNNDAITITSMPADHNFTGEYRAQLIEYVQRTLST